MPVRATHRPVDEVPKTEAEQVSALQSLLADADRSDKKARGDWRDLFEPSREMTGAIRWFIASYLPTSILSALIVITAHYGFLWGLEWLKIISLSLGLLLAVGVGIMVLISLTLRNISGLKVWMVAVWVVSGIAFTVVIVPYVISRFPIIGVPNLNWLEFKL